MKFNNIQLGFVKFDTNARTELSVLEFPDCIFIQETLQGK